MHRDKGHKRDLARRKRELRQTGGASENSHDGHRSHLTQGCCCQSLFGLSVGIVLSCPSHFNVYSMYLGVNCIAVIVF